MGKISIQDLSAVLVERNGLSKKDSTSFVKALFDVVQQALERDKVVKVKGLGTFKLIDVDDRESVNVNTGERVLIEGHGKITFTPDSLMKELVNKPFSQFETVVLNDGVDFGELQESVEPVEPIASVESSEPSEQNGPEYSTADSVDAESSMIPLVDFVDTPVVDSSIEDEPVVEEAVKDKLLEEELLVREPVAEEPLLKDQVDTVEERAASDEQEQLTEEEPEDEFSFEEEPSNSLRRWLIPCAACLLGLILGYALGNFLPISFHHQDNEVAVTKPVKKVTVKKEVAPKNDAKVVEEKAKTTENTVKEIKTPQEQSTEQQANPPSLHDQYAAKDARVRLGAYRIVGTDFVVKVKAGETLSRISRRYFGPDMECYVEVYNDLKASSELEVGQEIKIPKLVWKKKKTIQTNQ